MTILIWEEITILEAEKWTTEEGLILVRGWSEEGLTQKEISMKMGISSSYLTVLKRKSPELSKALPIGETVPKYNKWLTPEGLSTIRDWKNKGYNQIQIAKKMGVSKSTLKRWKQIYEPIGKLLEITENNKYKKCLTKNGLAKIKKWREEGESLKNIAIKMEISYDYLINLKKKEEELSKALSISSNPKYYEWITEEGLNKIFSWAKEGLNNKEIAKKIGIHEEYFYELKNRFPQITITFNEAKEGLRNVSTDIPISGLINKWASDKNFKKSYFNWFLNLLTDHIRDEVDVTWENFCKIRHEIVHFSRNNSHYAVFQKAITSFFQYVLRETEDVEIKRYLHSISHLLINYEVRKKRTLRKITKFMEENIRTNFPINSTPEHIYQLKYYNSNNNFRIMHFNINYQNRFLENLIIKFIDYLKEVDVRNIDTFDSRYFIYHLSDSLSGISITGLKSFNEKVYREQLKFFQSVIKDNDWFIGGGDIRILNRLRVFYNFLDNYYYYNNGEYLFNSISFNRKVIKMKNFNYFISNNYGIYVIDLEKAVPDNDKWVLVPNIETIKNVRFVHNTALDFSEISNKELREELKEFIWVKNWNNKRISTHFQQLVEFINEAHLYWKKECQVRPLFHNEIINCYSSTYILIYYSNLVGRTDLEVKTKNSFINTLKLYLDFIRDRHDISHITIQQLKYLQHDYEGGIPLTINDCEEINNAFKKYLPEDYYELMHIIFQLSITTKLRIGEIFSLERKCIIHRDEEKGYGTLKYYSKTSYGDYKTEIFLIKHIRLIERAIEITEPIINNAADAYNKKFVFIWVDRRNIATLKNDINTLNENYTKFFKEINEKLFDEEKIQRIYKPYSARDTYIDNAWKGVEDGIISTLEVSTITGNSQKVASKHYRNRNNIHRYIEALYETSVSEDEVVGEVIQDGTSIENMPPVQDGAGACSSEICVKQTDLQMQDSDYICLTCRKFVTTTARVSLFEDRLVNYKQRRESADTHVEKNFYTAMIELYSLYLAEMYLIMEEDSN